MMATVLRPVNAPVAPAPLAFKTGCVPVRRPGSVCTSNQLVHPGVRTQYLAQVLFFVKKAERSVCAVTAYGSEPQMYGAGVMTPTSGGAPVVYASEPAAPVYSSALSGRQCV
eukprot:g5102.t1